MSEKKLDEAILYAAATNKIEELDLTDEELDVIKNALKDEKSILKLVHDMLKKIGEKNGKTR